MTTTTIRPIHTIRGIKLAGAVYQVEIFYPQCEHRNAEGESDCNEPIPAASWRDGSPFPLGAWSLGLCTHHYIEKLREIAVIRSTHQAQDTRRRLRLLSLRNMARALRRYPKDGGRK